MESARYWIDRLGMEAHPEGGYFKEYYRAGLRIDSEEFSGDRNICTGIYFLLEKEQFSALHRIKSDELWHFYEGHPLEVVEIDALGQLTIVTLGRDFDKGQRLTHVVKAGHWFGSRPGPDSKWSLVGCTVAPGFDFADFEMPPQSQLIQWFPQHAEEIRKMSRQAGL